MSINVIFHLSFIHNFLRLFTLLSSLDNCFTCLLFLLPSFSFKWISSIITSIQLTGHRIFTHTCGYNKVGMREMKREKKRKYISAMLRAMTAIKIIMIFNVSERSVAFFRLFICFQATALKIFFFLLLNCCLLRENHFENEKQNWFDNFTLKIAFVGRCYCLCAKCILAHAICEQRPRQSN